jgi:hypothetical protein
MSNDNRSHADALRRALEDGDHMAMWRIMAGAFPGAELPKSADAAEIILHRIRVETESVPLKARAWSHRWLTERGLPSGLPDRLKPAAERMYPRVAQMVGISVNPRSEYMRPAAPLIRRAMEEAVLELHGDGVDLSAPIVGQRMKEAARGEMRRLFGSSTLNGGPKATAADLVVKR